MHAIGDPKELVIFGPRSSTVPAGTYCEPAANADFQQILNLKFDGSTGAEIFPISNRPAVVVDSDTGKETPARVEAIPVVHGFVFKTKVVTKGIKIIWEFFSNDPERVSDVSPPPTTYVSASLAGEPE